MNSTYCVCCGEEIPEGRQICWNCEHKLSDKRPKKIGFDTSDHSTDYAVDVFYLCDKRACEYCDPECRHTRDVRHAKNFKLDSSTNTIFAENEEKE